MNIPKILVPFLKPTVKERTPTDMELDNDIEFVSFILHGVMPVLKQIVLIKTKRFFKYRWKYLLGRTVILFIFLFLGYFAFIKVMHVQVVKNPVIKEEVIINYPNDTTMNLRNFLLQISWCESGWIKTANRDSSQYWGLFQLGYDARKIAKMQDVPKDVFLNHPEIQYVAMLRLLKFEKNYLKDCIETYDGKIVNGILITESGILALAHLGTGYVQSCLKNGIIPETDDYGNKPRVYAKLGGYNLQLDKYDDNGMRLGMY